MRKRLGVLCYKLMPATCSCLERLSRAAEGWEVRVHPLFEASASDGPLLARRLRVEGRPAVPRLAPFPDRRRIARELLPTNLRLGTALALVERSDAVLHLGLHAAPAVAASVLAHLRGKPTAVVTQTVPPAVERERHWAVRALKRLVLGSAAVHVAQTRTSIATLRQVYGVARDRIIFAPFEAGAGLFERLLRRAGGRRGAVRAANGAADGQVVFLSAGSLLELKGFDVLLEAFGRLSWRAPEARLWIAGGTPAGADGSCEAALRGRAAGLGRPGTVRFLGRRPPEALAEFYAAADAFVLATRKDCFPKVLVEAALAGLPLVTTDRCGAAGDLVRDEASGYVVPAGDAEGLADRLGRLLDAGRRRTLGQMSRTYVRIYNDPESETRGLLEALGRLAPPHAVHGGAT